jgi:prolyl 4-hydroxylase
MNGFSLLLHLFLFCAAAEEQVCTKGDSGSCGASGDAAAAAIVSADGSLLVAEVETEPSQPLAPPNEENSAEPPMNISPEDVALLYGEPQSLQGFDVSYMLKVDEYMRTVVAIEDKYADIREHCKNENRLCTYWATLKADQPPPAGGECDKNPAYMLVHCAPACMSCHKLIFEERCPIPPDHHLTNAWKEPGDLNGFFERITTHPHYQQFKPTVICKPGVHNPHVDECPWVVVMDEFLTEHECDTLVELGATRGYQRSEDVGERKPDGTYAGKQSKGRTSTNTWCQDECYANETVQTAIRRIENLTGMPDNNSEFLQLLRYEEGQFYESHHDYIEHNLHRAQGPRIITVFLYLNDVDAGGETHFTDLNISVFPKRGRALIWPSVLDADPTLKDGRTHHQAKPVLQGIKYGANAWVREERQGKHRKRFPSNSCVFRLIAIQIHLRDFKTPFNKSCI